MPGEDRRDVGGKRRLCQSRQRAKVFQRPVDGPFQPQLLLADGGARFPRDPVLRLGIKHDLTLNAVGAGGPTRGRRLGWLAEVLRRQRLERRQRGVGVRAAGKQP